MIDTIKLTINKFTLHDFTKWRYNNDCNYYYIKYQNIIYNFYPDFKILHVILHLYNITGSRDIDEINLNKLSLYVKKNILFKNIDINNKLASIDFNFDLYCDNQDEKNLYIQQFKKLHSFYRFMKKKLVEDTTYMQSKSVVLVAYDKDKSSNEAVYKNVIRLEVRLKRAYIYRQLKNNGISDKLINYFDISQQYIVFNKYVVTNLYKGDYYSFVEAQKLIKQHYRATTAQKIINVLRDFNVLGKKRTFEIHKNARDCIKKLEAIGVNPITINREIGIKYLPSVLDRLQI